MTLAEFMERFPDRRARWQAGHAIDGMHLSALVPEHTYCNAAAGARTRNRVAGGNNSERWY